MELTVEFLSTLQLAYRIPYTNRNTNTHIVTRSQRPAELVCVCSALTESAPDLGAQHDGMLLDQLPRSRLASLRQQRLPEHVPLRLPARNTRRNPHVKTHNQKIQVN